MMITTTTKIKKKRFVIIMISPNLSNDGNVKDRIFKG